MGTLVLTCYCDLSIGVDISNQDTPIYKVYSFSIIPDVPAFAQFLSLIAFLSVLFLYSVRHILHIDYTHADVPSLSGRQNTS